ncbi:MAG TPA: acetate--CoA ligase family protein [Verrucomicrobiae bacterium]|nr:acetate--CoA ligase family protein [Verrucomicrobiae bacterium]
MFRPKSIAVIGASNNEASVGHAIFKNILLGGFCGTLYPVNLKAHAICGVHAYPSITDVPDEIDLALVIVPANGVPNVIEECGQKGVRGIVVVSAGFKEVGPEGAALEQRTMTIARRYGMPLVGPNCLGVIDTEADVMLNASFARCMPKRGNLAFVSQSGALCAGILDYARCRDIGFSKFISVGNKADLTELDLLRYLAKDDSTDVILMYLETLVDGRAFIELAREITGELAHRKPILAIKSGRSTQGAAAARSHTGALSGSDAVYDAIFAQAGILRADTVEELFDFAVGFSRQPLPKGNRFAIVTNAGGPGVMATDAAIRHGLELAKLRPETLESLKAKLPPTANFFNPVDVIGDAASDRYAVATEAVLADPNVDGLVVLLTPQAMTEIEATAECIGNLAPKFGKPVLASFLGHVDVSAGVHVLEEHNIPNYQFPENASRSLAAMSRYTQWLTRPRTSERQFQVAKGGVREVLARVRAEGRTYLPEIDALAVLKAYGFPTLSHAIARTSGEAVELLQKIGAPVVLKIVSPDVVHKVDVGGVLLNISTAEEARAGFEKITNGVKQKLPSARLLGVEVVQMAPKGIEVILGISKDPAFGHIIMFGLGGTYVEVFKDVSFRLVPIRELGAFNMIHSIRAAKVFDGFRGEPPADTDAIAECLEKLSQLVTDFPEIAELDINPLIVHARGAGAHVADARIVLAAPAGPP